MDSGSLASVKCASSSRNMPWAQGAEGTVLDDCYADTAMTGYRVCSDARIFHCAYFNNWRSEMDNPTVFRHEKGALLVTGGRFSKNSPSATLYSSGPEAAPRLA